MTIKYAIKNPQTQEHEFIEDREAAIRLVAEHAFNTFVHHYNGGVACMLVDEAADGSKTWFTPTGEKTPSPEEVQTFIRAMLSARKPFGTIPVAVFGATND